MENQMPTREPETKETTRGRITTHTGIYINRGGFQRGSTAPGRRGHTGIYINRLNPPQPSPSYPFPATALSQLYGLGGMALPGTLAGLGVGVGGGLGAGITLGALGAVPGLQGLGDRLFQHRTAQLMPRLFAQQASNRRTQDYFIDCCGFKVDLNPPVEPLRRRKRPARAIPEWRRRRPELGSPGRNSPPPNLPFSGPCRRRSPARLASSLLDSVDDRGSRSQLRLGGPPPEIPDTVADETVTVKTEPQDVLETPIGRPARQLDSFDSACLEGLSGAMLEKATSNLSKSVMPPLLQTMDKDPCSTPVKPSKLKGTTETKHTQSEKTQIVPGQSLWIHSSLRRRWLNHIPHSALRAKNNSLSQRNPTRGSLAAATTQ